VVCLSNLQHSFLPADTDPRLVRAGKLVVFPTDTVYGIGCDAGNRAAIEAIYAAKGRSALKAIPLLLAGDDVLGTVAARLPSKAAALGSRFWPGALTLVVQRGAGLPEELGGGDTIAVRVPDNDDLRAFIRACGGAIAATSANLSGQPDALDGQSAAAYFSEGVALVVDGGPVAGGTPSTVVDCTVDPPAVLREGAIPSSAIGEVISAAHC
jgi:L-threonylcarbamoyladenylate synthase